DQLAKSLARDVRFEKVTLSLWPPVRLSVRRFEVAEKAGFDHGTALSAGAIGLDLDVFALFGGRVKVNRLLLDTPTLHLILMPHGASSLAGIGGPPGQAPPAAAAPAAVMDLDIREFRIQRGSVLVDDLRSNRRTAFNVDTRTSLTAEQAGR